MTLGRAQVEADLGLHNLRGLRDNTSGEQFHTILENHATISMCDILKGWTQWAQDPHRKESCCMWLALAQQILHSGLLSWDEIPPVDILKATNAKLQ